MVKKGLAVGAGVAVLVAGLVLSQRGAEPLKVSGFIEADEIRIGSRVGGRVARVHAVEGQPVRAGQVLVELEPFDLLERRAQAAAELAGRLTQFMREETRKRTPQEVSLRWEVPDIRVWGHTAPSEFKRATLYRMHTQDGRVVTTLTASPIARPGMVASPVPVWVNPELYDYLD